VEIHALEAPGAKVRLLLCNATSGLSDLEEAWVVHSLYREDRLDQSSARARPTAAAIGTRSHPSGRRAPATRANCFSTGDIVGYPDVTYSD
jgi:hypothetical protein